MITNMLIFESFGGRGGRDPRSGNVKNPYEGLQKYRTGTARVLDMGGKSADADESKEALFEDAKEYFSDLKRSFFTGLKTIAISLLIVVLSLFDLALFWSGKGGVVHPVLDIFVIFTASMLSVVAMISCTTALRYLRETVWEICSDQKTVPRAA